MLKTITYADLQAQVRQVLKEVGDGQDQYIVEQSGEPTAAIISMADFRLLQAARQVANMRKVPRPYPENEDDDLARLIEEARRVDGAIESGQMGTIEHEELKQLLLEKEA